MARLSVHDSSTGGNGNGGNGGNGANGGAVGRGAMRSTTRQMILQVSMVSQNNTLSSLFVFHFILKNVKASQYFWKKLAVSTLGPSEGLHWSELMGK